MNGNYLTNQAECAPCDVQPAGPIDQLKHSKAFHEAQLLKINQALEALNTHPELANILQLIGKALR